MSNTPNIPQLSTTQPSLTAGAFKAQLVSVAYQNLLAKIMQTGGSVVPDRFANYRERVIPELKEAGYAYFLACDHHEYQQHQEWCNDHCQDHTLPHCDVWQHSPYPRAFANKEDAMMFKLTFDATNIEDQP